MEKKMKMVVQGDSMNISCSMPEVKSKETLITHLWIIVAELNKAVLRVFGIARHIDLDAWRGLCTH